MMKAKALVFSLVLVGAGSVYSAWAYPPGVGILGRAKSCLACHVDNGPWKDDEKTVIDILDKETRKSLKQKDRRFLIEVKRGETRTVLTVIGRAKGDKEAPPYRNAWLYMDPLMIGTTSLSKFAPGWDVNLPLACRIVGDSVEGFEGAKVTVLPMTVRPTDAAHDTDITLQVMLTKGESVKGRAEEGMIGSYFERKVKLRVLD